ncbi:MAG TPA: penicillin-binding protein activator [Rhodanobacteraceae bacterium]|nr:penicillin-binding protein activator [Rhodanobacteraceae bacterium]
MFRIRFFPLIAIVSTIVLAGGCTSLGPPVPVAASPQAQGQYAHAEDLYRSGDYHAAANAFLAAAEADPPVRDRANLGAAESYRALGQISRTATLLQHIDRRQLGPEDDARFSVLSAEVALQRGHPDAALKQLASLPPSMPAGVRQHALDVRARAELAMGDRLAAARALIERGGSLPPAAQAANHQQVVSILAGMGNEQLTPLYASLPPNDPLKPYIRQALSQAGMAMPRVLPQPNQPVGTMTSAAATPQGYAMPAKVALLLPATGPVATAGAAVRDGFFTAYFHTPVTHEQRPVVKVYDTGGTADGAVSAYQQAVTDGAELVVGPLGRAAVSAVFSQPSLPVPVLALNHAQGNVPTPGGSYEFALLPEAEGAQLAGRMITLGLHAAIVFRGNSDTAARAFDAFKTQFGSLGGQVANDIVLPEGSVDFASQIQAALAGSGTETAIVALLRPEQARLLLPQLKLARSTLPVFATSTVYTGTEDPTADSDLDGVQFCDEPWLFDAQAGLPDHATLASQIVTAAGPAARLFGFGMDAYALIPYLGWLRGHPGSYVAGATGQLTMDSFGHVQRTPIWVQFQGGVARPIAAGLEPQPAAPSIPNPTEP